MNEDMFPIPEGYVLAITTWENDADNYKTKYIKGLTKTQVSGYLKICNLFLTLHRKDMMGRDVIGPMGTDRTGRQWVYYFNKDCNGGFGNFEAWDERYGEASRQARQFLYNRVYNIAKDCNTLTLDEYDELHSHTQEDIEAIASDLVYEVIGTWAEGDMYRVFESATVHYFERSVNPEKLEADTFL